MKKFYTFALAAVIAAQMLSGMEVSAEKEQETEVTSGARSVMNTYQGSVNFGLGTASITIKGNENQTLIGKKFHIYNLFHAENSDGNESINYTINERFAAPLKTVVGKKLGKAAASVTEYEVIDYIQTLNTNPVEGAQTPQKLEGSYSAFRYFIEEVRNEIADRGIEGEIVNVTSVKSGNSVVLGGLAYGYYVVDEITAVDGTNSAASMCMVNTLNPAATMNIKSDYPSVSKKIQEDDKRDDIGENGWNDMADFEIGQTVPYQFTSNVPDMNGYDTYYYAWHDVMDKALTFKPETVKISIRNGDSGKKYDLKTTEFQVIRNPGNGETFRVQINDLKAIVDREFDQMNSLGENVYGQTVVLRYDAVLNDNAADDTGRPGFENDVRLEFSNNPDGNGRGDTGETPWDTVVCFTYRLNGLKTNNHDLKLEGAHFRLYSDEACKNEVFVKKTAKGYNVINRDSAGGNDHTGGSAPANSEEMISSGDGVFTVFGLDGGTYWLKETKAPAGYRPLLDPIKIEVIPTFVTERNFYVKGQGATDQALKSLEFAARMSPFFEGIYHNNIMSLTASTEEGSGNLIVVNQVGKKLPVTGSSMMLVMLGGGCIVMCYAVYRKKRENEAE